jgi:hypothetical protein
VSGSQVQRVFIPSKLSDNPKIQDPDEYRARLRSVGDPWLVRCWEHGDWSSRPSGGVIKPEWLRTYVAMPEVGEVWLAADLAYRKTQTADDSCIAAFGMTQTGDLAFLPGIEVGKLDTLESCRAILDLASSYNAQTLYVGRDMITGSIGPFLSRMMEEEKTWITIEELPQHQDQLLRSRAFIARTQQGRVLWPDGELYRNRIRPQLIAYDGQGKQPDDIVACAAHACMGLDMMSPFRPEKPAPAINKDKARWAERKRNAGIVDTADDHAPPPLFGRRRA